MTNPVPEPAAIPETLSLLARIVPSADLPADVGAQASGDGKTIMVRASLSKAGRRAAVREVLAARRRLPRFAYLPAVLSTMVHRVSEHMSGTIIATVCVVGIAVAVTATAVRTSHALPSKTHNPTNVVGSVIWHQHHPVHTPPLPTRALSYVGVYEPGAPGSYAKVKQFSAATDNAPNIALYYSGWWVPFQFRFADDARANGMIPAVQIDPDIVSLANIAAGKYDAYLRSYADQVATYGGQVIIGFGHEMNGSWYSWGYTHLSPAVFVAAWRHIVDVFRQQGADNVTWLWTVNIIDPQKGIPNPSDWFPGSSYVTWIGIDGYYLKPSWKFAPLFGPTIKAVHALTLDPILIAETGATPAVGQPAKIADLFAGLRAYGLLGFVWFDANKLSDWRLDSPAAIAAFRLDTQAYKEPGP